MLNRRCCKHIIGAPNDLPALPIQNPNIFVLFYVRSAISIGAGGIGAPIGNADQAQCANNFFFVFGLPLLLAEYKEDDCVRFASPIFIPIAY